MFHHFGRKLPIRDQFWWFGGKYWAILNFSFYNLKKAHPCAILRRLSHYASKSVRGLFSRLVREKSHKKVISSDCPEGPRERIFTKFGLNVSIVEFINRDKLCINVFKGFDFTGVRISISHRKLASPL